MPKKSTASALLSGYCFSCKSKKSFTPVKAKTLSNGTTSVMGKCPSCSKGIATIVSKKQAGSGILGSLLGFPEGKIPVVSDIPLIGQLL